MARALSKTKSDGSLYLRQPEIEQQIDDVVMLGMSELRQRLTVRQRGIEMIAPNRQKRRKTQDGRLLRRYRHRWKIERLFAWLKNFGRICCRWERRAEDFLGMVQLGCMLILLRHLCDYS
jgi:transposase